MDKIVDKIRKLLRLARDKGASEAEAATALAMAQKLMLEHNIKNVEEQKIAGAVYGNWVGERRGDQWERRVAMSIARMFNCRSLTRGDGTHRFVGKPENVEVCELTFLWVCEQVEALYKQALIAFKSELGGYLGQRIRGNFRQTFKEGCSVRIWHRVCEIIAKARNEIPQHMALVVIDQSLAEADNMIKHIKSRQLKDARAGLGSRAGYAAGDQVRLQGEVK